MYRFFIIFATWFTAHIASAQFEVAVNKLDASNNRALATLEVTNALDQPVKNARLMIIMLDDEGKVVGAHNQWLMKEDQDPKATKEKVNLVEPEKSREFNVLVKTTGQAKTVNIICSRLVLADGTLANVQSAFRQVPPKPKKK